MGVLNITPDSFSDGGRLLCANNSSVDIGAVVARTEEFIAAGAVVVDVGGESTRPGAAAVDEQEELRRVIPVVEALCETGTLISVDTRHAEVARVAIQAGAHLINDISAGADPDMLDVVADSDVGYAVMHMQGTPATMQAAPVYADVLSEVREALNEALTRCARHGINRQRVILDPGFGFGKTLEHNLRLLADLESLRVHDRPLLVGLSRKSMLGKITGRDVTDRLIPSVSAALLAAERGADILRVHDVAETRDALLVREFVLSANRN